MKRNGIIHAELARSLALLRHTDRFVIADAGLPVPAAVPLIDLGVVYGVPSFADVLRAVLADVVVERATIAAEIHQRNPAQAALLAELLGEVAEVSHEHFKTAVGGATFVVRTGEASPYSNVILQAGVPFG